ncbi:MAG: Gfo/Idh/MocA family oxidoreductase [Dehalococcoidia bacterium]
MISRKLRVGVAGLGFIATGRHLPVWARLNDVELAGVCDVSGDAVDKAVRQFNASAGYSDLAEMIEKADLDIIDLCTPPKTHASMATIAMERGCHVLMEKPMAITSAECNQLVECAANNKVKLSVIHNMLHYPPVLRALELVRNGTLGEFRGMRLLIANPTDEYLAKDTWVHQLPGGLIGETGPHIVYLSLPFIGKVKQVFAHSRKMSNFDWASADDFTVELVGEKGSSSIRVVHNSDHWSGDLEIWGTTGKVKVDLQAMIMTRYSRRNRGHATVGLSVVNESFGKIRQLASNTLNIKAGRFKSGHERIIEEFARSVKEDLPPPVSAESAAETVTVLEEIVRQLDRNGAS